MKKLVRILGLIQQIRNKKQYSTQIRLQLIRTLLFLEYKSLFQKTNESIVCTRILHYKVFAYGYRNLWILFREIFVDEEYQYFVANDQRPVIIDCGANIGLATLYLKWKFPNAQIHALEPDPTAFELLKKNVTVNGLTQVTLYNKAAMSHNGQFDFFIAQKTKASLMMSTLEGRMNDERITVEGIHFPQFVKEIQPVWMKMDIEGAEKAVCKAMEESGSFDSLQQIIMEYHHKIEGQPSDFSKMLRMLEQNNFEYNLITRFSEPGKFQDILIYAWRR